MPSKPVVTIKLELPLASTIATFDVARKLIEKIIENEPGVTIKNMAVTR